MNPLCADIEIKEINRTQINCLLLQPSTVASAEHHKSNWGFHQQKIKSWEYWKRIWSYLKIILRAPEKKFENTWKEFWEHLKLILRILENSFEHTWKEFWSHLKRIVSRLDWLTRKEFWTNWKRILSTPEKNCFQFFLMYCVNLVGFHNKIPPIHHWL